MSAGSSSSRRLIRLICHERCCCASRRDQSRRRCAMSTARVEVNQIELCALRDSPIQDGKLSRGHLLRHRLWKLKCSLWTTPSNDLQRPVPLLDHRGPVLHPVTVVHVQDVSDQPMIRAMNMSANHAVGFVIARGCEYRAIAEVSEELEAPCARGNGNSRTADALRRFHLLVCRLYQSWIRWARAYRVRPDDRQQTIWIQRAVELMPMDHKHPGAVSGGMNQRAYSGDAAEQFLDEADFALVVISGKNTTLTPLRRHSMTSFTSSCCAVLQCHEGPQFHPSTMSPTR